MKVIIKTLLHSLIGKSKEVKGFTLIELIVVIAILGILAMLIMPNVMSFTSNANEAVAQQHYKIIDQAYIAYVASGRDITGTVKGLNTLSESSDTAVDILGESVKDVKFKNILPNGDGRNIAYAVIKVNEKYYKCRSKGDGTVETLLSKSNPTNINVVPDTLQ